MPVLQKEIGSVGAKFRPLFVGPRADLSAMREDLATEHHVTSVVDWVWRGRRGGTYARSAAVVSGSRRRDSGAGVVAAGVRVCRLARHVWVVGQFSIEMRMA